jgi:hypothetical protein
MTDFGLVIRLTQQAAGNEPSGIQKCFKGLRPRPVQLAKILELGADGEAGEANLIIKNRKRSPPELEALLKHELIHYQLKDKGEFFHGHGRAFLKRAQALGIVNSYVLERCFSSEEFEHFPTVRKTTKVPLGKFARQVDHRFSQLIREAVQLPEPYGSKVYPHVQNAYVGWLTYSAAVREKSNHVIEEIWKVKRGARGKDLHELQKEYGLLQAQHAMLAKRLKSQINRQQRVEMKRQIGAIDAKLTQIRKQVERDYGILLE